MTAPQARFHRRWLIALAAMGLPLAFLPDPRLLKAWVVLLSTLNLATSLLQWQRGETLPPERQGWRLLALSTLPILLADTLLACGTLHGEWVWVYGALVLAAGGLQGAGLLRLPWRRTSPRPPLHHLGTTLFFGTSLVLVLWMSGTADISFRHPTPLQARALAVGLRLALLGGVVAFLAGQDARRLRGPLGWMAAAVLAGLALLGPARGLVEATGSSLLRHLWFASAVVGPLCFSMAALSPRPAEASENDPPMASRRADLVPYVPFILGGLSLCVIPLQGRPLRTGTVLLFVLLTGLLLFRQMLLLEAVREGSHQLEARVAERTADLLNLQAVMVRTERLNTLATLGAGVAHDLNNLLSTVQAALDLVRMSLPPHGALEERMNRAQEAAQRAGRLTRRLLALGHGAAEEGQPTDLAEVVVGSYDMLRMMLPAGIELRLALESEGEMLVSHPVFVEQMLVNLVTNARDALERTGCITVRLVRAGDRALLDVEDNGPGVPEALRTRIFEAFFTTKPPGLGTGVGLSSVASMARQLGGRVELVDRDLPGACFRLHLPLLPPEPPTSQP